MIIGAAIALANALSDIPQACARKKFKETRIAEDPSLRDLVCMRAGSGLP